MLTARLAPTSSIYDLPVAVLRRPFDDPYAACRLPMTPRLTLSYVELQAPTSKDQALHRPRDVPDETR